MKKDKNIDLLTLINVIAPAWSTHRILTSIVDRGGKLTDANLVVRYGWFVTRLIISFDAGIYVASELYKIRQIVLKELKKDKKEEDQ